VAVNGKAFEVVDQQRVRLMLHFTEKIPACTPSIEWWIVVAVIYPLVQRVEATFISVQGMNTLVCEQKEQFLKLLCDMQVRTNVEGPMTAQGHARLFPLTPEEQASEQVLHLQLVLCHSHQDSRSHGGAGWNESADGA
jgi:hypothetical protein